MANSEYKKAKNTYCEARELSEDAFNSRLKLVLERWDKKITKNVAMDKGFKDNDKAFKEFFGISRSTYKRILTPKPDSIFRDRSMTQLFSGLRKLFEHEFGRVENNFSSCFTFILDSFDSNENITADPKSCSYTFPRTGQIYIGGTDDMYQYQSAVSSGVEVNNHISLKSEEFGKSPSDIQEYLGINADAYIGVIGRTCGAAFSEIDNSESRAEIEFNVVRERWPNDGRFRLAPVFIYEPMPGSEPYKKLKQSHPAGNRQENYKKLKENIRQISEHLPNRGPFLFKNNENLAACVSRDIVLFASDIFETIGHQEGHVRPISNDAAPQNIEFRTQVELVYDKFKLRIKDKPDAIYPGFCLFIHGSLQQHLVTHIVNKGLWFEEPRQPLIIPGKQQNNMQAIWLEIWHAAGASTPTLDRLTDAKALAKEIIDAGRPVQAIICNIHHLENGVQRFCEKIWFRIYDELMNALKIKRVKAKPMHVLNVVLTQNTSQCPLNAIKNCVINVDDNHFNYRKMIKFHS